MPHHRIRNLSARRICLIAATFAMAFLSGCTDAAHTPPPPVETVPIAAPAPVTAPERREPTDELIAQADYGALIPYHGANTPEGAPLYGLLTIDGTVVTNPVFTVVYQGLQEGGPYDSEAHAPRGFFLLSKTPRDSDGDFIGPFALAASDGRWCTEFKYQKIDYPGGSFLQDLQDYLVYVGKDGTEQYRMLLEEPYLDSLFGARWSEGTLSLYASETSTTLLVHTETGERIEAPGVSLWGGFHEGLAPTVFIGLENNFGYINRQGKTVIPARFARCDYFQNGVAVVTLPDGSQGLIDKEGYLLLQSAGGIDILYWDNGLQYFFYDKQTGEKRTVTAVYDESLRLVDSPLVGKAVQPLGESWVWYQENGATTFVRGTLTKSIQIEGRPILMTGDKVIFERTPVAPVYERALVALDGTVLVPYGTYSLLRFEFDLVTGLPYVQAEQTSGCDPDAERVYSVLNIDGGHLAGFTEHQFITMAGGNLLFDGADFSVLRDLNGNWLFYTSFPSDEAG